MKLGLAVRRFGRVGGMESVAFSFAHWLVRQGHDVDVWASGVHGDAKGVRMQRLRVGGRGVLLRAHRLRSALRRIPVGQYDGFLHFERGGTGGVYRAGAGCHASWVEQRGYRLGDRWLTALDCASMGHARGVVVNSHMVRSAVLGFYGLPVDRIHLVRNCVDTKRFVPAEKTECPTVVFPGGQVPRKGLRVAVEALRHVPETELIVLGKVEPRLQRWALENNPRVRFVGQVADPERIMGAAHAMILPTLYDPSSNAVLEAMACGVPPVTTEYDGAAELLPHPWMAIADPLDAEGFAEVLMTVMNEPHLPDACQTIACNHSLDVGFSDLLAVMLECGT